MRKKREKIVELKKDFKKVLKNDENPLTKLNKFDIIESKVEGTQKIQPLDQGENI